MSRNFFAKDKQMHLLLKLKRSKALEMILTQDKKPKKRKKVMVSQHGSKNSSSASRFLKIICQVS